MHLSHGNVTPRRSDTSHGSAVSLQIPRLVEMPHMEKVFPQKIQQITHKIWCGATRGHACKNEVVIEQYCIR